MFKRKKENNKKIQKKKIYNIQESLILLKNLKPAKFKESIDIACLLNINPKKSDQNIRGTIFLPYGTGKKINIAVFAEGKNYEIAKNNGIKSIGMEDLSEIIQKNPKKFDLVLATPESMHIVKKLGPILGPKGLMPNPKLGTITENLDETIKNFKKNIVSFKNDKNCIVHCSIGKIYFSESDLYENFISAWRTIKNSKPKNIKGIFIKKIYISTTMGPGIQIDHTSLEILKK